MPGDDDIDKDAELVIFPVEEVVIRLVTVITAVRNDVTVIASDLVTLGDPVSINDGSAENVTNAVG